MSRPFDFSDPTWFEARLRQGGVCARCGEDLTDLAEYGHHVVPNQSGKAGDPNHFWLRSADNCVVVCNDCHYRVHQDGRYNTGAVAPPEYYPHSHGNDEVAHRRWVGKMTMLARQIWASL